MCHAPIIIILYYDQQMHNYLTNYHTLICSATIVSSSGNLRSMPCQVTQLFKLQLLGQYDSDISVKTATTQTGFMRTVATKSF